ncbi:MAG: hypothetical protein KDB03_02805 [Planctomycetales bacterium]|nr:hypothetical protein [Planctomycetales bacterium]
MRIYLHPRVESLESRIVLASIAGTISVNGAGIHVRDPDDLPVANGFIWFDSNQNGQFDPGEPSDFSDVNGEYQLENVTPGEVLIRMKPPMGLIQTFPYEHFAMQMDNASGNYRLAKIDSISGEVMPLGAASDTNRNGLIKTVDGEYFASGHVYDSLYKIDAETGEQTLVGHLGQQVVGGLAYDPLMDEVYTLARPSDAGEPVPALRLFKIDRATATLIPVSDSEPSISGIRSTTSLAFDWVNREIVLFDNFSNSAYAYNLQGEVRKLGVFAPADRFYNLSFDGFRFLTHRDDNILYEVDPILGTLTPLVQLSESLSVNAGDRLATNEPHRMEVSDDEARIVHVDFLVTKLKINTAQLEVSPENLKLLAPSLALTTSTRMGDTLTEMRFCVAGNTNLELQLAQTSMQPVYVTLGEAEDRVSVNQAAFDNWPNLSIDLGTAHDILAVNATQFFDLDSVSTRLSGVDEIQLLGTTATTFQVEENSLLSLNESNSLTVRLAAEDRLQFDENGWFVNRIDVSREGRAHVLATDQVMLTVYDGTLWHNPLQSLDVNFDGHVTTNDALIIINLINRTNDWHLSEAAPDFISAAYVDTNADNALTALDALLVINQLNHF